MTQQYIDITAGSGTPIAIDVANTVYYQQVKIQWGAYGTVNDVSAANPLPVSAAPAVSTANGTTGGHYICTGATNQDATQIKGSAGNLYGGSVYNLNSTPVYFKLYNTASPTSGSTPVLSIMVPANSTPANGAGVHLASVLGGVPLSFSSAIGFRVTGGIADNDTTTVTTQTVLANYVYN
jgi:hypothetical protein